TGSSASAQVEPGSFEIVQGEERLRAWKPDGGAEKWFCGDCGSALFSRDPDDATKVAVRLGSFDEDPGIRPTLRQFRACAAVGEPRPDDGLPRYPESRLAD